MIPIRQADQTLRDQWRGRFDALPADSRSALRSALLDLQADARQRANLCWRRHKAPMALYWKVVAVYAGHLARCLK